MGEDHGFIAVERIDYFPVCSLCQHGNAQYIVIHHTAENDPGVRRLLPNLCNGVQGDLDLRLHDLVQQLKRHGIRFCAIPLGKCPPQTIKPLLQRCVVEKDGLIGLVQRIKGIAVSLVQIENHAESVLFAPVQAAVQIDVTLRLFRAVLFLQQHIVHRHTHVIQSQFRNGCNILLCDKCGVMFCGGIAGLREPSAQIDTVEISFQCTHCHPSFRFGSSSFFMSLLYVFFGASYIVFVAFFSNLLYNYSGGENLYEHRTGASQTSVSAAGGTDTASGIQSGIPVL